MPKDLREALMQDELAWQNFRGFAGSYRHIYIFWVTSAKREETRRKRMEEVVRKARQNAKFFMG
jgi:uncharacterized protein YdeI (YjbR/CyaY-like superfamily)